MCLWSIYNLAREVVTMCGYASRVRKSANSGASSNLRKSQQGQRLLTVVLSAVNRSLLVQLVGQGVLTRRIRLAQRFLLRLELRTEDNRKPMNSSTEHRASAKWHLLVEELLHNRAIDLLAVRELSAVLQPLPDCT